jgi:hypothetical protein
LFLRHALLITETYVSAVEVARDHGLRVIHFATEPDSWRQLADRSVVKPDATLALAGDGYEDWWFVEADCGSEGPMALRRKLALYRKLYRSGAEQERSGVFPRVLFVCLDERRRHQLAQQLTYQPSDIRAVFAVTHLSSLAAMLRIGPESDSE